MFKYFIAVVIFLGLFLNSSCTHSNKLPRRPSQQSSSNNFRPPIDENDVRKLWIKVDKNQQKQSLIRSNPAHYWAWMKFNTDPEFEEILSFEGQITGDPHFFNFGDIHSIEKNGLALGDLDDSGFGPYFYDFLRYAIFVKAYLNHDFTEQLLNSYINGLEGQLLPTPLIIEKSINTSYNTLEKENLLWVLKNLKKDFKLDNKKLEVTGLKNLPNAIKIQSNKIAKELLTKSKLSFVYDGAYTKSVSGSSINLDRYWFSALSNDSKNRIIECKELDFPATGYFSPQNDPTQRIHETLEVYSDFHIDERFSIAVEEKNYWCRPREWFF